ncbi:MAG: DUF1840 family protein [Burkholderiales bacterium]|nr:DUF1840 family protein [Burkholderiales bacterium]MDE1927906.1 DUF1840 family protein [Burkholderiales bacterium]MDE2503696.1 DUF1840 family protein [Burkholderiales bacterium]
MIYKFKSSVAADLIMLGADGDRLLRLIGREPAPKGIIEPGAMGAAVAALEAAIAQAEEPAAGTGAEPAAAAEPAVGLRQRLWPMVQLLRQCQAADAAVVWGV